MEPKEIKLYDVFKIINKVVVKRMVLLKTKITTIEEIIENDQFNTEFSTEFLFNIKHSKVTWHWHIFIQKVRNILKYWIF